MTTHPFNLKKFLLLMLISCAVFTTLILLAFPKGFMLLIFNMQVKSTGGWGHFHHMRELATSQVRQVAKPNRDTIYSTTVVDLSHGPIVVFAPAYNKYWNLQMLDDRSDVFGYLGSRIHGTGREVTAVIVPPGYSGDSAGLPVIEATSEKVWLIFRFLVAEKSDIAAANSVQDRILLTLLADYLKAD